MIAQHRKVQVSYTISIYDLASGYIGWDPGDLRSATSDLRFPTSDDRPPTSDFRPTSFYAEIPWILCLPDYSRRDSVFDFLVQYSLH